MRLAKPDPLAPLNGAAKLLASGALMLFGIGAFATYAAQMYRCVDDGKVIFSDQPCGDNAKPIDIRPPSGAAPQTREESASPSRKGDPRNTRESGKRGRNREEAERKSQLQGKRVQCIADDYNAWYRSQQSRPTKEERDAQMAKVREDCRRRYPEGAYVSPPEPRQATIDLDVFRNAIKARKLEGVKTLLDASVDPDSVFTASDPTRKELRTPALIFSVNNSTEEITSLLIERGANIAAVDNYKNTALHAAARRGRVMTMDLLLSRGADIATRNSAGHTPLHSAIHGMQLEAVKYLIARGAPINARSSSHGTPLVDAVTGNLHNDRLPIIRYLLNSGADPNISGMNGNYPLHVAVIGRGNQSMNDVIRALIEAGATIDVKNGGGETVLSLAERLGRTDVTALLGSSSSTRR